mmetsp:Transcript_38327/g.70150  ORF Transcript_38327/g.70150 Transcript_38327/m.70150 type:complete len:223 (+) Transcript_38327:668-1336(+)
MSISMRSRCAAESSLFANSLARRPILFSKYLSAKCCLSKWSRCLYPFKPPSLLSADNFSDAKGLCPFFMLATADLAACKLPESSTRNVHDSEVTFTLCLWGTLCDICSSPIHWPGSSCPLTTPSTDTSQVPDCKTKRIPSSSPSEQTMSPSRKDTSSTISAITSMLFVSTWLLTALIFASTLAYCSRRLPMVKRSVSRNSRRGRTQSLLHLVAVIVAVCGAS